MAYYLHSYKLLVAIIETGYYNASPFENDGVQHLNGSLTVQADSLERERGYGMKNVKNPIRVLMFEDKQGCWSAQCLDYDIATQAKTFNALLQEVERVINGHIVVSKKLKIEPFANLKPAPPVYWQLYGLAKTSVTRESVSSGLGMPQFAPVEARVAELQAC